MQYEFYLLWMEQCEAAYGIKEKYGLENALKYLIGEKMMLFVRESWKDPLVKNQLPLFVQEVKNIFTLNEIRAYLKDFEIGGSEGQILSQEELEFMQDAEVFPPDPVKAAEDVMIVEQLKEILT